MGNAMMDQLLKAGLVDKKKASRAKQQKRDKKKAGEDNTQARARQLERERQEKAERDRLLNQQKQYEQEQQAAQAQIRQMVKDHRLSRKDAEIPYHFTHGDRIPSILVTEDMRQQLARDQLHVVYCDDVYEIVPNDIAKKIRQRNPAAVISSVDQSLSDEEAKAYEDFPVPDDLVW